MTQKRMFQHLNDLENVKHCYDAATTNQQRMEWTSIMEINSRLFEVQLQADMLLAFEKIASILERIANQQEGV